MCKSVHPTEVYVPTVFFIENIYCFNMLVNTKVEGIKDSAQPNLTLLLVYDKMKINIMYFFAKKNINFDMLNLLSYKPSILLSNNFTHFVGNFMDIF